MIDEDGVFLVDLVSEVEHVAVAGAAAGLDRDAQAKAVAALGQHDADLVGGGGGNRQMCHEQSPGSGAQRRQGMPEFAERGFDVGSGGETTEAEAQ